MLHIRPMTIADVPMAMVLKTEAGWNQVEADWHRFLKMQPDGCFVAELGGEPVGTTVTCVLGKVAWVAMVLVAKQARGCGIGTALVRHALEFLDARGVRTVRLDATSLGRPVYERLGFSAEYTVARYSGKPGQVEQDEHSHACCQTWTADQRDHERIIELDAEVTGTSREKYLDRLFHEGMATVRVAGISGGLSGYLAIRSGSNAMQLGPCIGSFKAGAALVSQAGAYTAQGEGVYMDVPTRCESMVLLVERVGLTVQREFVRMCRGVLVREDASRLLASSGPELG